MRLLVTGGAGFIGSAFVARRLKLAGDEIVVLDKLTYSGNRQNLAPLEADPALRERLRFVHADIADRSVVDPLVDEADAVVNFAAESHVDRSILDAADFLHTGVIGVHVLLEAVRRQRRPVRYVQVSTDEVYGDVEQGLSVESDPLAPRSPYAAAKAAGDLLVHAYHATHGLDTLITRGANTFGPRQHPEKLIPLFITNALDDQPLPLYGDGLQQRDWVHVDDHAEAIGLVLERGAAGQAYNIPGSSTCTNRAVTEGILAALGKPWELVRSVPDRPGHDRRYAMDGARLAGLGWRPTIDFADGLAATVAWYAANRDWWEPLKSGEWHDYYRRQYGARLAESVGA